jgi:DNA invertase Pin-like site-specific DNA recombinase
VIEKQIQIFHNDALVRNTIKGKKAVLRVAAYCRVSTLQEEQEDSYETQFAYFRKRIRADPSLQLVEVYGDRGISGLSTEKRPEFRRMMDDCINGKIDIVMTKSISRFARNLADCIASIRRLKERGIPILFEKEGLNTMDTGCDMLLSVLAALAQEESNNISQSIQWAHEYRNAAGRPIRPAIYGYRKKKGKWEIYEPEAARVRLAFQLAGEGYFYQDILAALNKLECQDQTDIVWNQQRIYRLLINEVYTGNILTNKTFKPDLFASKLVKNVGQRHQYYIEGHHEALVDRETFQFIGRMISEGRLKAKRQGRES